MCEKPYDGGPFLTYPVRENRPEIRPDAGQAEENPLREHERLYPTPSKEFEAFCQTWLFFGLINEVLGNICQSADFVRPDEVGDGRTISTSRLRTLVEHWVSSVQDGSCIMTYGKMLTTNPHDSYGSRTRIRPERQILHCIRRRAL